MPNLTFLILFTIIFFISAKVLEYTDSNFNTEIALHEISLVKFYAPWCGHCKRLAPEFDKAAKKLAKEDIPIQLIKVDCTTQKTTCDKFGVTGFPTLKIFRNGEFSQDYEGPRDADGIVKYMNGQAGPSARELKTQEEFDKFIDKDETSIVGFFESESKLKDSFHKVADTERDRFKFGFTTNKQIIDKFTYKDDIVAFVPKKFHNKFESNEFRYDGNYDTDKIKSFLIHETNGIVGIRTQGNIFQFTKRPLIVTYFSLDYIKDPKGSNYWRNRVFKIAEKFKNKIFFAVSNKDEFAQEIEQVGLSDRKSSDKPIVAAFDIDNKYPMNKEFSVDNLYQFVKDFQAGKLQPFIKSESLPIEQKNLKVVVGKNFKELVTDADTDVLLEFYAPWCGHCKALAPKFEKLADTLAKENVIIAKIDATANDYPSIFKVQGYPTIYWISKNDKSNPVPYQGEREVKDFIKFIARHSTDGLLGYNRNGEKKKQEL